MAEGEDERDRRYARSYQGLLNFCMENTKAEDAVGSESTDFNRMSEERKQWLEKAIAEMSEQDPVKAMMEDLKVLQMDGDSDKEQEMKELALEDLQEHCESMDCACDFHKIGGYAYITQLLKSDNEELKWRAAELLGTTVQNNPYCQQVALQLNYMPLLLKLIDNDPSDNVRVKGLYATSCLTREMKEAQEILLQNDGFSVLMRAMQTNVEKLKVKAAFMLTSLCQSQPKFKDVLCDMGMVEQLIALLRNEHNPFHEHLMSALLTMVQDHLRCKQECQRGELDLKVILEQRMELLNGKDEYLEEYQYAKELLKICFGDTLCGEAER